MPKLDGVPIKFRYLSPLSLVKGEANVGRFIQYMQTLQGTFGPDAAQLYINTKNAPYLLADDMQIDTRYLNDPNKVAEIMQQQQDQKSMMQLANSQGMMPEQPQNPSEQFISPGGQ